MTNAPLKLRKAAVLIRSIDADTAAGLLAQFSPEEAAKVRAAIRTLGPVDAEEQADVLAEFRRARPLASQLAADGVELQLASTATHDADTALARIRAGEANGKRFAFLERAPIDALVAYLAREHVQTIAVVLSNLSPARAAVVLAALPEKLQADTVERLSALGETDPESVTVLEHELAAWLAQRAAGRPGSARRRAAVAAIFAATDTSTRSGIMANLKAYKGRLAEQLAPIVGRNDAHSSRPFDKKIGESKTAGGAELSCGRSPTRTSRFQTELPQSRSVAPVRSDSATQGQPQRQTPTLASRIPFDDLIHLDTGTLAAVLRDVDANVLVLALAGSHDELVDRICDQMPKRTARAFRAQLRRLGPTRLSDVQAAQCAVAQAAANLIDRRRNSLQKLDS